jgi:hypothetical protein
MPAFTFEKISPEKTSPQVRPGPTAAVEKKPRRVIFQVLDRLVVLRAKRIQRKDNGIISRREQRPRD